MSTAGIDVLAYAKDLEEAGFNRAQAEAIAKGSSRMLVQQFESLVTREHFDRTKQEFKHEFEQVNYRLTQLDKRLDGIERGLANLESTKSRTIVLTWMMGLVILVLVVPQLQAWFSPA